MIIQKKKKKKKKVSLRNAKRNSPSKDRVHQILAYCPQTQAAHCLINCFTLFDKMPRQQLFAQYKCLTCTLSLKNKLQPNPKPKTQKGYTDLSFINLTQLINSKVFDKMPQTTTV